MSGGAANGAFGAGFTWRLLGVLQACRSADTDGCPGMQFDLAAGTSTGALITLVVDDFFTPGQEAAARDLVLHRYTCSVAKDLYCVNDTWDWELVRDLKGLVRFDGPAPKHAFTVLARTIDLLVTQPKIGEVTESDLAAVVRRLGEYTPRLESLGQGNRSTWHPSSPSVTSTIGTC